MRTDVHFGQFFFYFYQKRKYILLFLSSKGALFTSLSLLCHSVSVCSRNSGVKEERLWLLVKKFIIHVSGAEWELEREGIETKARFFSLATSHAGKTRLRPFQGQMCYFIVQYFSVQCTAMLLFVDVIFVGSENCHLCCNEARERESERSRPEQKKCYWKKIISKLYYSQFRLIGIRIKGIFG